MQNPLNFTRLSAWQQALVRNGALPSAITLVSHKGQTVFLESAGWSDVDAGIPVQNDSIYRLYSMSKPLVSIALMMLYEEGRFQLHDPAYLYLGAKWRKENMTVFTGWQGEEGRQEVNYEVEPCASDITMVQLLTHNAGLSYGFDPSGRGIPVDRIYNKELKHPARKGAVIDPSDTSMLGAFCDALADMPLLYQPGTQWNYSYATDVLGRLVEVLSGQPLDRFMQERLFGPLGMVDAGFDLPAEKAERLVHNYRYVPPGTTDDKAISADATLTYPHIGSFQDIDESSRAGYLNLSRPKFLSGGGGLVGTISDYSAFCRMILAGGVSATGERLMGRKTLQFIGSNHLPDNKGLMDLVPHPEFQYSETAKNGGSFGLGFSIVESPQAAGLIGSVGNMAWGGAASTIFWIDPVEDLHVVFFTQVMGMQPANALRAKLGSLIYSALD
jgi:CubicO group peptidase (beta-lactamase class C family)